MAGVLGNINKSYVSSINFLDQREILNKVLDVTNEEMSFLDIMELTGRSKPTSVPFYNHFVNEELYVLGTVSAVTGSGVSAATGGTVTATIDSTAFAYVNVGELVLFPDGKVGYVATKSAATNIVVKSVDTSTLTLASGDKISFFSNAAGEGSLSPEAKKWGVTKYDNQVQIFKGKFSITDIQKASKVEVEFQGKPFYMYKGQHESLIKFRGDIASALMFGRKSSTLFADAAPNLTDAEGKPVQTTGGLDQWVTSYGIDQSLLTAGTATLADIQTLTQTLNKARCPQEYFLFVGTTMNIALDNLFNNLGNSALLSQGARFQISGKSLDLGIDTVKIYGRTFHKKYLPLLDHKNIVNYTGSYNFKDSAYGAPAGKIKTNDGQMIDRLGVRYMAGDGTDLKYREILLGGLAPVPTNERSVLEIHYESVQGLEVLGANQFFKLH
jgi:hypothetical protein